MAPGYLFAKSYRDADTQFLLRDKMVTTAIIVLLLAVSGILGYVALIKTQSNNPPLYAHSPQEDLARIIQKLDDAEKSDNRVDNTALSAHVADIQVGLDQLQTRLDDIKSTMVKESNQPIDGKMTSTRVLIIEKINACTENVVSKLDSYKDRLTDELKKNISPSEDKLDEILINSNLVKDISTKIDGLKKDILETFKQDLGKMEESGSQKWEFHNKNIITKLQVLTTIESKLDKYVKELDAKISKLEQNVSDMDKNFIDHIQILSGRITKLEHSGNNLEHLGGEFRKIMVGLPPLKEFYNLVIRSNELLENNQKLTMSQKQNGYVSQLKSNDLPPME